MNERIENTKTKKKNKKNEGEQIIIHFGELLR